MSNPLNHEKSKDKKKSFVERLFNFASTTIRLNKRSESNSRKKKPKESKSKSSLDSHDGIIKVPHVLPVQTCTFCDYCDLEIVADFKGQNIICHDFCKQSHEEPLPIDNADDLEKDIDLLSSIKSAFMVPSNDTIIDTRTNLKSRLSISLNDLSDTDLTMVVRNERERSLKVNLANNCLLDTETGLYTFSTVDLSTIKQYGISIKKMPSVPDEVTTTNKTSDHDYNHNRSSNQSIDYLNMPQDDLKMVIEVFNNNDQGLFVEPKCDQIMGKIRVFINLLRPIKMLLTARPPSSFDMSSQNSNYTDQSTLDRAYYNKEVIFWLPRGTTKLLYVNLNCPTTEVISLLLAKFNIQNNPKKFALYQHTVTSPKEVEVCKLKPHQCPLKIILDWCTKGAEYFHENIETKRFVLQENDPGSIEWDEFSAPELRSFLKILREEEEEKRKQIVQKYEIVRGDIYRRLIIKGVPVPATHTHR